LISTKVIKDFIPEYNDFDSSVFEKDFDTSIFEDDFNTSILRDDTSKMLDKETSI